MTLEKGVENFIHSFFYSSFFFFYLVPFLLDSWFLVFIHRDVWILSFWCEFYPSLHRASSRSCYGRKNVFSFFDHPWFKWIRDEVGLSARHIHVDLYVSSLNGPFHDVFFTRWRFEWWWKDIFWDENKIFIDCENLIVIGIWYLDINLIEILNKCFIEMWYSNLCCFISNINVNQTLIINTSHKVFINQ